MSFSELDKEECGENDMDEKNNEGLSWEESNQKKACPFFLKQAQTRKAIRDVNSVKGRKCMWVPDKTYLQ